jgi:hypothetical protein
MAFRSLALSVGFLVILWGCGESPGDPRISGGSSGGGGTAGSGGSAGSGGTAGSGGSSGSGGGGVVDCTTSLLCLSCPSGSFCETDVDCSRGFSCIETGCDDVGGQALKQCTFAGGGACESSAMCANGRECIDVPRLRHELRLCARLRLRERKLRRSSRSLRPTRRAVPEESRLRRHDELQLLPADPTRMRVRLRLCRSCSSLRGHRRRLEERVRRYL